MLGSTYLFIDGGYLQKRYREAVNKWLGDEAEIDFSALIQSHSASRSFYYDCFDKEKREGESDSDYKARIAKQYAYLDRVREAPGCHIRLGSLKGQARGQKGEKRQKEVDIMIAVDMLTHAAHKNMSTAILLAGDQDFKPAVESLVQLGIFVMIVADERHTARELTWAASSYKKLSFYDYYHWSLTSLQSKFPLPTSGSYEPDFGNCSLLGEGFLEEDKFLLYQVKNKYFIYFPSFKNRGPRYFSHEDLERLKVYIELNYSKLNWDQSA